MLIDTVNICEQDSTAIPASSPAVLGWRHSRLHRQCYFDGVLSIRFVTDFSPTNVNYWKAISRTNIASSIVSVMIKRVNVDHYDKWMSRTNWRIKESVYECQYYIDNVYISWYYFVHKLFSVIWLNTTCTFCDRLGCRYYKIAGKPVDCQLQFFFCCDVSFVSVWKSVQAKHYFPFNWYYYCFRSCNMPCLMGTENMLRILVTPRVASV